MTSPPWVGKSAELFAGELGAGGYGAPIGWDNDGGAIQDNPARVIRIKHCSLSTVV